MKVVHKNWLGVGIPPANQVRTLDETPASKDVELVAMHDAVDTAYKA